MTLENKILFDSGKATLKSATSKELDQILSVIKQKYASKDVDVVGHTDTDPIVKTKDQWKDNLELSAQRALSVTRYLIDHGIPDKQVRADACGAARPVASNASADGKAKNRRVEIVVNLRQRSTSPAAPAAEPKAKPAVVQEGVYFDKEVATNDHASVGGAVASANSWWPASNRMF